MPLIQAERFQVALGAAGAQASFIRIEGGAHNSPFNKEIEPAVQAFFDKHLRGIAPPEPPKPNLREKVIIERDVEYGMAGDRPLVLDVVRPKTPAAGPLPVVAYFHGGGWNKWDKSTGIGGLVPVAATGNYFCVTVGYRLAKEALWPAQIHDCKAAIRWLKANAKRLNIDPDRIAVWGASSGGHLAAEVAVTGNVPELEGDCGSPGQSSRVACCVDYTGRPICGSSGAAASCTCLAPGRRKSPRRIAWPRRWRWSPRTPRRF